MVDRQTQDNKGETVKTELETSPAQKGAMETCFDDSRTRHELLGGI